MEIPNSQLAMELAAAEAKAQRKLQLQNENRDKAIALLRSMQSALARNSVTRVERNS